MPKFTFPVTRFNPFTTMLCALRGALNAMTTLAHKIKDRGHDELVNPRIWTSPTMG
jgi:hypothetical protein